MSTSDSIRTANKRLRINFNQLEYAIAAADHGSFQQAAEALSVMQSTLSRSIQILEHGCGVAIFERSTGGVRATSIGRHFLRTARSILEQLEALNTVAKATGRGEAVRLLVRFCTSLAKPYCWISDVDFRKSSSG